MSLWSDNAKALISDKLIEMNQKTIVGVLVITYKLYIPDEKCVFMCYLNHFFIHAIFFIEDDMPVLLLPQRFSLSMSASYCSRCASI